MERYLLESRRYDQNSTAPQGAVPFYPVEAPQEFDEEGKELGPDAQVWKTYVREADQVDEEIVDGWNKSMDVILIFAALFSAIPTAYVPCFNLACEIMLTEHVGS
ncbi:transmembrane protein, putative, partial [Rhizoctonia solani AG-3 Rhs1AP]